MIPAMMPTSPASRSKACPLPRAAWLTPPVKARHARPTANAVTPGPAERCAFLGGAGRPESAAGTGTWATVLAGLRAARTAVAMANTAPVATAHQGRFPASTIWPVARCRAGT